MLKNIVCLTLLLLAQCALADKQPNYLSITWENDLFTLKDGGYTNGISVAWAYNDFEHFSKENIPPWLHSFTEFLYISTMENKRRAVSYNIGQGMQTASKLSERNLIEDEAPYAGLTMWRAVLYAFDDSIADRFAISLGFVGPVSGAEPSQRFIHKITGSTSPKGWSNQLNNEMVFQLSSERLWLLTRLENRFLGFDIIGSGSAALGTLRSDLSSGLSFRLGHDLARTFPTAALMPGREVNPAACDCASAWSVFVNIQASYVANNILINGNTFEDSHSVPLVHWQAQLVTGAAFSISNWAFMLSTALRSKEYKGQTTHPRFGSLNITYNF